MADISLIEDDPIDGSDEGVFEQDDSPSKEKKFLEPEVVIDETNPKSYIFHRYVALGRALMCEKSQMAAIALMELFNKAPADVLGQDLPEIMDSITEMTMKNEKSVVSRSHFLEQIPNIAATAAKYASRVPELNQLISEHLLPIIFPNLSMVNNNVRKIAQSSLIALMEKNLVTTKQIETQICPTILELTDPETLSSYDTDYITLMSQFVLLLGREVTERVFLGHYSKLCACKNVHIRKACVSHIGDYCAVVGKEAFDNVLLPTYTMLCSDKVWGVRKSCAEVIMYVSCACSPVKRQNSLAPVFAKFLQDESRWVRMSAFRTLGHFISTFADPAITTLTYNNRGELVLMNKDGTEFRISQTLPFLKINNSDFPMIFQEENELDEPMTIEDFIGCFPRKEEEMSLVKEEDEVVSLNDLFNTEDLNSVEAASRDTILVLEKQYGDIKENLESKDITETLKSMEEMKLEFKKGTESTEDYNSYKYWYISPEMPLDPNIVNKTTETVSAVTVPALQINNYLCNGIDSHLPNFRTTLNKHYFPNTELIRTPSIDIKESIISNKLKQTDAKEISHNFETSQFVVPQLLIDHFVSMTNVALAEDTDNEMAFYCAYSLPAVVLTLGSKNWHLIQDTVEILAANMHYKVRRTVACSLHELAMILGPDIATKDLTPIFEGFIKDLDEVRIGVLKHLAHFLRLISPSKRNMYLPWLEGFLQTDNKANWRFRQKLAEQLLLIVPLFRPGDVSKHISFLAQELLCDKVAAVREVALLLVTEIIQHVSSDQTRTSCLLVKLAEKFAHSIQWKLRQLFALLCSKLLTSRALLPEQFASEVMPHLLDLSWDPVPNVRLVVARTIAQHIVTNEFFADSSNQHYDSLQSVLRRLQSDKDRDVRQSAVFEQVTYVPQH